MLDQHSLIVITAQAAQKCLHAEVGRTPSGVQDRPSAQQFQRFPQWHVAGRPNLACDINEPIIEDLLHEIMGNKNLNKQRKCRIQVGPQPAFHLKTSTNKDQTQVQISCQHYCLWLLNGVTSQHFGRGTSRNVTAGVDGSICVTHV